MRPGRGVAAASAVVLLGVSGGCTGSTHGAPTGSPQTRIATVTSPAPTPVATTPPPPSVPTDVPTTGPNTSPGEAPPVMAAVALTHTADGALAFARFFVQTIDWGFATTSSAYMRHYYQPSCVQCGNFARNFDNTQQAGGRFIGGRAHIQTTIQDQVGGPNTAELVLAVVFDTEAVESVDAKGTYRSAEPAHRSQRLAVGLHWTGNGWSVVDLRYVV